MAIRVMVVDDSRMIYAQMKGLLEGTDYEAAAYCQDGETAVAQYGQIAPDLVTMDIIMPGMDGLETAQAILEDYPDARIIMVSSLAYGDTYTEAEQIGAKGFLEKPFVKEQLLEVFQNALEDM